MDPRLRGDDSEESNTDDKESVSLFSPNMIDDRERKGIDYWLLPKGVFFIIMLFFYTLVRVFFISLKGV